MSLSPRLLLTAYAQGVFPMDGPEGLRWYAPDPRAIIPLDDRFHVPDSLARVVRQGRYRVTVDTAFEAVMRACGGREETWITERLVAAYVALFERGYGHSVECWTEDGTFAGGLYGVALGGAFFGESMVSHARDASKVALVHLVARLRAGGFALLDTQFLTPHLARFGAVEIRRRRYEAMLASAIALDARWDGLPNADTTAPAAPPDAAPAALPRRRV